MKRFLVAIVLFVAFASALATAEDCAKNKLKHARDTCNSVPATAVPHDDMIKYIEHDGPRPDNLGAYSHCMCVHLKLQNADGTLNTEEVTQHLQAEGIPQNSIDKLKTECFHEKSTKEETAEQLLKCIMTEAKKHRDHQAAH